MTDCTWTVDKLNPELIHCERIHNTLRPYQALGYLTPQQFVLNWQAQQSGGSLPLTHQLIVRYKPNMKAVFPQQDPKTRLWNFQPGIFQNSKPTLTP